MIAKDGRQVRGVLFALAMIGGVGGTAPALAQQLQIPFGAKNPSRAGAKPAAAAANPSQAQNAVAMPALKLEAVPVNPTDPICVINNEVITRAQLANECVVRKGEEILDTMIARRLIDQALRVKKLEVTGAEVDQEIDNVAMRVAGLGRQAWLRTLDKERGISPAQYARDIIYPALALRKLAAPQVQVTQLDLKDSFEAQYGEKLRCRMIMVDKLQTAKEIWEELRKNPGGFEKLAMERSMDSGSRSLGGLLAEPISRHAYPKNVSEASFEQLVDGDPKDKDPSHKPKNGDFTGPIQVAQSTWILLRREDVIAAQPVKSTDENVRKATYEMIYDVKLKEEMGKVMVGLMEFASVDNKLTGKTKMANEPVDQEKEVQLMGRKPGSNPQDAALPSSTGNAAGANAPNLKNPTPAGLPPEVAKQAEPLTRPSAKK